MDNTDWALVWRDYIKQEIAKVTCPHDLSILEDKLVWLNKRIEDESDD